MATMMRTVQAKCRMDAQNCWGGSVKCWRLVVKKAWHHPKWEDTMQQWYYWLHVGKKDVGRRREEEHQKLVNQMISGAEDALVLAQNHETSSMERLSAGAGKFGGRCQAHERCEDKGKSGRSIGSVQVSTLPWATWTRFWSEVFSLLETQKMTWRDMKGRYLGGRPVLPSENDGDDLTHDIFPWMLKMCSFCCGVIYS